MAIVSPGYARLAGGLPRIGLGDQSGKVEQVIVTPPVVEEAFTGGFWYAYEEEMAKRKRLRRKRLDLEEQAEQVHDEIERAIAREFRKQDAERARIEELERLNTLVERHMEAVRAEAPARTMKAVERAIAQRNYSAMEAVERELRMLREEELFLMEAVRLIVNA